MSDVRFPRRRFPAPRAQRAAAALCLAIVASPATAADAAPERGAPVTLYVGQAHVLQEPGVRRIAVGNGKVIQATALDERQVLVLPESPGQSTLLLWGRSGPERSYVFNVLPADTGRLLAEVRALIGESERVSARIVGDKVVVEGADVPEALALRITEVGRRYPQMVNLLPRVGQERMIAMDVKFIEIRRDLLENIGVKWGSTLQGPTFQVVGDVHRSDALRPGGAAQGGPLQVAPRIAPFASSLSLVSSLTSMINLLVQSGDAAILAEPRLSCRSGGTARFVAGGELPIPVSGALGTASVSFKEYGIKFDVSPIASETGLISAKVATEISAINFDVTVKEVPGLTKRRAETEVNLKENETLVIAGLMTEEGARTVDRIAGASELPVLGRLFRSRLFRDRQSELVVFVTPRFVEGAPMPTDAASIEVGPMRPPTRLLPPPGEASSVPLDDGLSPVDPPTGDPPRADDDAPAGGPGTDRPAPGAEVALRRTLGEDRGVSRRWAAARERLRMVE